MVRKAIHGDEFTSLGQARELEWFRTEISKAYAVKFRGRLGPRRGDDRSIRTLNRIVQWNQDSVSYEADQRHA